MDPFEGLGSWPSPPSVAVVGAGAVLAVHGPDTAHPWASVTKLLTSLAVLAAVAEGSLDLDEPAGPPGSTVRHLLAHASGLAPDNGQVVAAPGRRRVYSNAGFEVLAGHLAARVGVGFPEWLHDQVLDPLELSGTRLRGSPAHGASGPVRDLAALGRELLAPTLLEPALMAEATRVAFPGLGGVLPGFGRQDPNDWGLGFELRGAKAPHWTGAAGSPGTFGHFGRAGSFLWVDPEAGLACACLTGHEFGPWAARAWPRLSDAVLAAYRRPPG